MKKLIFAVFALILSSTLQAVKVCAPLQDGSSHERIVSNNPAVQLGSPNRDSITYHTSWRYGQKRARWHDKNKKSQWRKDAPKRYRRGLMGRMRGV